MKIAAHILVLAPRSQVGSPFRGMQQSSAGSGCVMPIIRHMSSCLSSIIRLSSLCRKRIDASLSHVDPTKEEEETTNKVIAHFHQAGWRQKPTPWAGLSGLGTHTFMPLSQAISYINYGIMGFVLTKLAIGAIRKFFFRRSDDADSETESDPET